MTGPTMAREILIAGGVAEFLKIVRDIREEWDYDDDNISYMWFRGHQRKNWRLVPSIFRIAPYSRETEDDIREEFAIRAPGLSRHEAFPDSEWNLLFLMQHYGAPTRLLDWTESPIISLFFALRDNPGYYDSAVWILDPYGLNGRVLNKPEVFAPGATGTSPKDSLRVGPWLPDRWTKQQIPEWPIALFPTHIARRISSQKSCFTIHGRREDGFGRFAVGSKPCLRKVIVPARSAKQIFADMKNYGVDETTIFPDLEGLGRSLITRYRTNSPESPHRGVYVRLGSSGKGAGGVGLFAVRRIPKGARIFAGENEEICWRPEKSLPKTGAMRRLYDDFSVVVDGYYGTPPSFNRLTPAWFMSDSKKPNVEINEDYDFYALRDISIGEELSADFTMLGGWLGIVR
jgi:hypothetical protein